MSARPQRRFLVRSESLGAVGLLVIAGYSVWLVYLMGRSTYDAWGALLVAPALLVLSLPAFRREAAREGDAHLFTVMTWALVLKLGAAMARYYVAFGVYGGVADARRYLNEGGLIASNFRDLNFTTGLERWTGTGFPSVLTGITQAVVGPTSLGTYLMFSWLGFWGLFFFYRAFVIGVPEGRTRTYARLVFFLPSLLFWPSGVGKEAWMVFGLGLAAYGGARVLTGALHSGAVPLVLGVAACAVVRPHIAAMVAVGVVVGYVVRPSPAEQRETALVVKSVVLAALTVGTVYLVQMTDDFLTKAGVRDEGGVAATLQTTMFRTQQGGSSFDASVVENPSDAPKAAITVLFRPLLPEGRNLQGYLAGAEGTLLLAWSLWRWRWILQAVRSIRRQPYVAATIAFVGVFVFGFSSIANFGILARQRAQVLPFYLVLLAIPTADWWASHRDRIDEEPRADAQPVA